MVHAYCINEDLLIFVVTVLCSLFLSRLMVAMRSISCPIPEASPPAEDEGEITEAKYVDTS